MGRRSHPIFEHFTRGAKLSNSSNRYEQLCNYCGAHFAQGRPTPLQKHLHNCPSIPAAVQSALFPDAIGQQDTFEGLNQEGVDSQRFSLDLSTSPFLHHDISHEFHGLDALASASLAQPFTYLDVDAPPVDPQLGNSFAFTQHSENLSQQHPDPTCANRLRAKRTVSNKDTGGGSRKQAAKFQKTRGVFSDTRKQEVHEVRKKGACMRCRSLNKVCGVETPCEQCMRIAHKTTKWPFGCIRIENGKTFTLFNLGLHTLKARRGLSKAMENGTFVASGAVTIVHSHHPSQPFNVSVSCCKTSDSKPVLLISEPPHVLLDKATEFLDSVNRDSISVPPLIGHSLRIASYLSGRDVDGYVDLKLAVRAWKAIVLLSSPNLQWTTSLSDSDSGGWTTAQSGDQVLDLNQDIVVMQLNEALESCIDKDIFAKLDRRLGSQKEKHRTETVLLMLILLNAAERFTWHLEFLQRKLDASAVVDPDLWPFEELPSAYLRQGTRLAALYNIWAHCRHLIPSMSISNNGVVHPQDPNEADSSITELFARSDLSTKALRLMDEAEFDSSNEESLDGKFWAQLFLEKDQTMLQRMKRDWRET